MIIIQEQTPEFPLQLIGQEAGTCWGAPTKDKEKNIERAKSCILSGHGRTMEFPDIYMTIDGFSAKCIRELYTHHIGTTRLQASTRYIDYSKGNGFNFVTPRSVARDDAAMKIWQDTMQMLNDNMVALKELGVPTEDFTNLLPLAYKTKMVWKINLRGLEHFMNMRLCSRAYWEIRLLANELVDILRDYSDEWKWICDTLFVPNCEKYGYCIEEKCCGRKPKKEDIIKND